MSTTVLAGHRIGGELARDADGVTSGHLAPWNRDEYFEVPHASAELTDRAVAEAAAAFHRHRDVPSHVRRGWLQGAAIVVERNADLLADLLVRTIGKPRRAAEFEVRRSAGVLRLCAEEIGRLGGETLPIDGLEGGEGVLSYTLREPRGPAALITPFNAPLNLLAHKLGPALAVGNSVVIKPSIEGAVVTDRLAELLDEALPPGTINLVHGGPETAQALAGHQLVSVVSLTGGIRAGESILAAAGVKPVLLELGSNSPNIVLADADLADAAAKIARAAFEASGQQCISAQRILVDEAAVDRFIPEFVTRSRALKVGDPADPSTDVGPVINERAATRITAMIEGTLDSGGRLLLDGRDVDPSRPLLLGPTLVGEAPVNSPLMRDEVFGPVAIVHAVTGLEEAVSIANATGGLLQASCFTADLAAALWASRRLAAGGVWINEATRTRFDTYPFGGTGRSGVGREGVRFAMEELSQLKHVAIRPGR